MAFAGAACRDQPSCFALDPAREPDRASVVCRDTYERTKDPKAAVAVSAALSSGKQDAAIVAWAQHVGEAPGTARVWRRAYKVHQRRGERAQMIEAAQRAVRLWEQARQPGEASYDTRVIMNAHYQESELLPALQAARRERALALASDDQVMRRASFVDLFDMLEEIGEHTEAKAMLRDMQRELGPADPLMVEMVRFAEGLAHFHDGHFELARLAYRDALKIDDPEGADTARAIYYNLAEIDVLLGDVESAARDLASAIAKLPDNPPLYMQSARAVFTTLVARARHDAAGAEATARQALAQQPIPEWDWTLEDLLGGALEDQGRLDDALAAYERAIDVIEKMRREVALDVLQTTLRERKRAPYKAAFELQAARGPAWKAMAIADQMWQRGFQDSFAAESRADEMTGRIANDNGPASPAAATPTFDPAAERVRSVTALIPQLVHQSSTAHAPPAVPREARPDVELLAFVEGRSAIWRYSRGAAPERLERLALTVDEARRLVAELRAHPDNTGLAARLGAALIPGSAVAPRGNDQPLAIIVDGPLADLPFAALRVADRWLVQYRPVAYWPGLHPVSPDHPNSASPGPPAVVLAATTGRGKDFDLAAARMEAVDVARRFGVEPLIAEQVSIAALRRSASAGILHVAAHGGLAPGGAFVRLADGDVTATDVVTWHLAPRVVVLASCASGARPSGSMWGALGGAFLAAGSHTVVATLWSVEDAVTAALVRAFYAAGGERDPARALAMAQRQAIASGVSPRHWVAFVVLAAPE